jgi:galactokinase
MAIQDHLTEVFRNLFTSHPEFIVRAPGRVNLIGEHTDYNDGYVLPMAIDQAVWIAVRPTEARRIKVDSLDFAQTASFDLDNFQRETGGWIEYLKGVAWVLQETGLELMGWEGVIASDIPIGAGLSSSAALELATARSFAAVTKFPWDGPRMAKLCQQAENQWVGVNSGIMDQMISACGEEGHALLIDCRSLDVEPIPLPSEIAVLAMDTCTRRGLRDSAYNERRAQCEAAADFFNVDTLRDVNMELLELRGQKLDELIRRRARHVISENERTLNAVEAMKDNDPSRLGKLLNESHHSLRDDFEVSSPELNALVDCALQDAACFGARMTGAGFGGCAVALVDAEVAETFTTSVAECYLETTGRRAEIYICEATKGADVLEPG